MTKRLEWWPVASEIAAGSLQNSTGSPVEAVSVYGSAPSDGRPLLPLLTVDPNDGRPTIPVSYYAAGTLQTSDGRPVAAVNLYSSTSGSPVSLFERDGDAIHDRDGSPILVRS